MFRIQRFTRPGSIQDDLSNSNVSSSSNTKKRCSNLLPLVVALVVIAEIAFLGRLDMAENSALVNSVAESFYHFTISSHQNFEGETCEDWLEREDALVYSRDFIESPILVRGPPQDSFVSDAKDHPPPQRETDIEMGTRVPRSNSNSDLGMEGFNKQVGKELVRGVEDHCTTKDLSLIGLLKDQWLSYRRASGGRAVIAIGSKSGIGTRVR